MKKFGFTFILLLFFSGCSTVDNITSNAKDQATKQIDNITQKAQDLNNQISSRKAVITKVNEYLDAKKNGTLTDAQTKEINSAIQKEIDKITGEDKVNYQKFYDLIQQGKDKDLVQLLTDNAPALDKVMNEYNKAK